MPHVQQSILHWVAAQPQLASVAVFFAGLLLAFQGYRFYRAALAMSAFGLGWIGATIAAPMLGYPSEIIPFAVAAVAAGVSLAFMQPAIPCVSGGMCACLAYWLAEQCGFLTTATSISAGAGGILGVLFAWLCPRATTLVLTALQGSALMIIGFAGAADLVMPSVASTFREWAMAQGLLTPLLMGMLLTAAYSVQASQTRGQIIAGAQRSVEDAI